MDPLTSEEVERLYKPFTITSVCRGDLESAGFDTTNVDDSTMAELASKMANAYCDLGFWEDLEVLAQEYFKIPERLGERNILLRSRKRDEDKDSSEQST